MIAKGNNKTVKEYTRKYYKLDQMALSKIELSQT